MKQTVLLFLIAASLMGCEAVGLRDEKITLEVKNVNKNDLFSVNTKNNLATSVSISVEGELSHDARIHWSASEPDADTTFVVPNEILLPKGKVNVTSTGDYYSKKLYVKYVSLSDSTSGNLQIKIKI